MAERRAGMAPDSWAFNTPPWPLAAPAAAVLGGHTGQLICNHTIWLLLPWLYWLHSWGSGNVTKPSLLSLI